MSMECTRRLYDPNKTQLLIASTCASILGGQDAPSVSHMECELAGLEKTTFAQREQIRKKAVRLAEIARSANLKVPANEDPLEEFARSMKLTTAAHNFSHDLDRSVAYHVFVDELARLAVELFPDEWQAFELEKQKRDREAIEREKLVRSIQTFRSVARWFAVLLPWSLCAFVLYFMWGGSVWLTFILLFLAWNVGRFGPALLAALLMLLMRRL